jgi:uncharacterized membrane protein
MSRSGFDDGVWVSSRRRVGAALGAGAAIGGGMAFVAAWQVTVLATWCAAAATLVFLTWLTILPADAARTQRIAGREDNRRVVTDLLLLAACALSLIGVGFVIAMAADADGLAKALLTALGVLGVVLAWAVVHTVFTLRYADLYYSGTPGGIDFNEDDSPDYRDFAYLAFTVGMTYQVSDTDLRSKAIRRTALKHALLSFVFGTSIIAVTINIVAGLAAN